MGGSRRRIAPVAGAIGLVVTVLASACGGSDFRSGTASPGTGTVSTTPLPTVRNAPLQATLLRAVQLTMAARTARSSISVTLTGLGGGSASSGAFDVAGTGIVDLRTGNSDLSLSVPRFDRLGSHGPIEQRIVGGVSYIATPAPVAKAGGLPASVRWLSLDPRSVRPADPSGLAQSQVDPVGQLAFLGTVSENVRRVRAEPVRGVAAVRYTATVDVRGPVSPRTTAAKARLATIAALIGTGRLRVDVWLDASDRVRRVVVLIPLTKVAGSLGGGAGPQAVMRVQSDLYAFGTALRVSAPPAAQVRPYSTLHIAPTKG